MNYDSHWHTARYPAEGYLVSQVNKNTDLITVLFTQYGHGEIVRTTDALMFSIGEFSQSWNMCVFSPQPHAPIRQTEAYTIREALNDGIS